MTETPRPPVLLTKRLRELATDVDTQVGIMGRMNVTAEDSRLLRDAAAELDARERIIEIYEQQLANEPRRIGASGYSPGAPEKVEQGK